MTPEDLLASLRTANSAAEVDAALARYESAGHDLTWTPVGGRENNRGTVEVAADPGRSLVERVTNAIDAVLEAEHDAHDGRPDCRSPKDAALAWLGVPEKGLSEMGPVQRRALANRVTVRLLKGSGKDKRVVEIQDQGTGIAPDGMRGTILSLNESNKLSKHYLAGLYGQGGSSTYAVSDYTLIACRADNGGPVGFTLVKFLDLPPDTYRTGHYAYMLIGGQVPAASVAAADLPKGVLVRHVGYDLSAYPSPIGPHSLYGLLNTVLFDPVMPVLLETDVFQYKRRVIKGARNALNGAVDDGDESTRGPEMSYHCPLFHIPISEFGSIGVEYWVLAPPADDKNKQPNAAFVNPKKPVVLSVNGQNHAELSHTLVRKNAELPYLANRLICHVACDGLTMLAKRLLFVSNREDARRGVVYDQIEREMIRILRSDDQLGVLNREERDRGLRDQDDTAKMAMRREVARLLRLHGFDTREPVGRKRTQQASQSGGAGGARPTRPPPQPIELHDPPTYIRLVWEEDEAIDLYPGQRRYLRVETDAPSSYHVVTGPAVSRINPLVIGDGLRMVTTTPLEGGRMRVVVECVDGTPVGGEGTVRVELMRPALPMLQSERKVQIVEPPHVEDDKRKLPAPEFDVRALTPADPMWSTLNWPDGPSEMASQTVSDDGKLTVYYSSVFPKFADRRAAFERRSPALAASFTCRYEIWLAVHSFLLDSDQKQNGLPAPETSDASQKDADPEEWERRERIRVATLASLIAAREAETLPPTTGDQES